MREVAKDYPDVEVAQYNIDAIAARMVMASNSLDIMVSSNRFGDILTDHAGGACGIELKGMTPLPCIETRRAKLVAADGMPFGLSIRSAMPDRATRAGPPIRRN